MDATLQKLQQVFQSVFGDDQLTLTPETTADDVDGWDSLTHLNLIVAVEKTFGIKISTAEISRLKEEGQTVGDLVTMIRRKSG